MRRADKLKAQAKEAAARTDEARVKYDDCIGKVSSLTSSRTKLAKYHEALCNRCLPSGYVTSLVLTDVLKLIQKVESTCTDKSSLELLLSYTEDCMFYINRDRIEECNLSDYRAVYANILIKLLQCNGTNDMEFALYYGLLMKNIEHFKIE